MKKQRILIVAHQHPDINVGGAQLAAHRLFNALKQREDCDVLFIAGHSEEGLVHPEASFSVHAMDELLVYMDIKDPFWVEQSNKRFIWKDFHKLLETYQPTVVHFEHYRLGPELIRAVKNYSRHILVFLTLHEFLPICANGGQMVKKKTNKLCYISNPIDCHSCFPNRAPADFLRRELFFKSFFKLVDCFIAPSQFLKDRYIQWGLEPENIVVMENGLVSYQANHGNQNNKRKDLHRFSFFGRIAPLKGLDILVRAVKMLSDDTKRKIQVSVHGALPNNTSRKFTAEFNEMLEKSEKNIRFYGPYKPEQQHQLMADTDWVVVPSTWWENAPTVISEAFISKRPVICSDIGGMAEMVQDNFTGLHFRAGDPMSLASKINRGVYEPRLWEYLSNNISTPTGINEIASRHMNLYDDYSNKFDN